MNLGTCPIAPLFVQLFTQYFVDQCQMEGDMYFPIYSHVSYSNADKVSKWFQIHNEFDFSMLDSTLDLNGILVVYKLP